jgi:two-component system sensor histidine kinase FlrB
METSVASRHESAHNPTLFDYESTAFASLGYLKPVASGCTGLPPREVTARLGLPDTTSSLQLDDILQLLPTGVVLLDSRGMVAECNAAASVLLQGEVRGCPWREVIARNFQPRCDDGHEISLRNGKRISLLTRSLEDRPGQLIVLNDLTETRMLQQQLARHQRLSDMGKMISSLAHQIRTPLSAALLYTDNLAANFGQVPGVTKYTDKMLSRLQNIERQIRDMLFFVRGEAELNERIEVRAFSQRLQKELVETNPAALDLITWALSPALDFAAGYISCHSDALFGAVSNLLNNALQASAEQQIVDISIDLVNRAGSRVSPDSISRQDPGR